VRRIAADLDSRGPSRATGRWRANDLALLGLVALVPALFYRGTEEEEEEAASMPAWPHAPHQLAPMLARKARGGL